MAVMASRWVHHHALGLIDQDHILILIDNIQVHGLRLNIRLHCLRHIQGDAHVLLHLKAGLHRTALRQNPALL